MGDLSKNISRIEIACPCCGLFIKNYLLIEKSQRVMDAVGRPFYNFNSGVRCEIHNVKVGGGAKSQHKVGFALDVSTEYWSSNEKGVAVSTAWNLGMAVGVYSNFIHWDVRNVREPPFWWGAY